MKQDDDRRGARSLDARLESLLMRRRSLSFHLWQLLLVLALAIPAVVLFATLAIEGGDESAGPAARVARSIAGAPKIVHRVVYEAVTNYNPRLARKQRFEGERGLSLRPGAAPEGAALVLSRYDGDEKRGVVEIVDLNGDGIIHAYRPDIEAINALSKLPEDIAHLKRDFGVERYVMTHPVALPDGSLVFHGMDSPLVRIDACSRVVWTVDGIFHHSTERDAEGNFWTAEKLHPSAIPLVDENFNDDAIAKISPDGEVLFRKSVAEILLENGYRHIVYSHDAYDEDPIHLNDVQPALEDGPHWRKGDLFLSIRNASMIALYRPSTNELLWTKQGPWLRQHDVDIISDHEIAVFNNNSAPLPHGERTIGSNTITIYDFADGTTREPFAEGFRKHEIRTETNGLFRFLADGSVMIEEHDYGRLLALGPDSDVRWSFVNRAEKDGRVFHLGWSRVLAPAAAAALKQSYAAASCPAL